MPVEWVTFDCYGTLIDWERGITDALLPLLPPETDRRALAEWYIAMEAEFEAEGYHLYKDVLDRVGRRVLHSLDASIPEDKASPLPASLGEWRPFPEVRTALRALVDQGRSIAILSNVDRDLLELSIEATRARATVGEISDALEKVFGRYRANVRTISGVYGGAYAGDEEFQAIRKEVARYAERFRAAQVEAVRAALADHHVAEDQLPPIVALLAMTGLSQVLALEAALGVTTGHDTTREFIERTIDELEHRR